MNFASKIHCQLFREAVKNRGDSDPKLLSAIYLLTALIAYAGRTDAASIVAIAERMGDFVFIPGAADESDVSHYFLDHNSEYTLHPDLEDFFDHQRFGEHLAAEYAVRFTDGGFVCMNDNCTLEEILRPVDEEAIT